MWDLPKGHYPQCPCNQFVLHTYLNRIRIQFYPFLNESLVPKTRCLAVRKSVSAASRIIQPPDLTAFSVVRSAETNDRNVTLSYCGGRKENSQLRVATME